MLQRVLRLYPAIHEYFARHLSHRALFPVEWQAVLELVRILDDPARIKKQIQGGHHGFVGQAINQFAILHAALEDPVQEIRSLQPWDGPKKEVSASTLQPHVRLVLTELVKQMEKRGLGRATTEAERINLVLDPRLKSCCEAVCLKGGEQLQQTVRDDMSAQFQTFDGSVRPRPVGAAGAGGGAAGADEPFAPSSAPSPAGAAARQTWAGGGAADPATVPTPAPARPDRLAKTIAKMNQFVARLSTIPSASETRTDAGLCEFSEFMAEAALTNNSEFDLLEYWRARPVDRLDASGKVVAPARWPHVGLVAREFAGIDTTSCQAERNFSFLKLVVSDLRVSLGAEKIEKILFFRLNRHLIPGLGKIIRELESLKEERDGAADAAFIAKTTAVASIAL